MQPILKEWELCFTFFRAEDLRKVFGILLYRMFVYAPSFIHSFSSVSTNGYLILLNFVADIFSLWPLGALFSWLLCPFDIPQSHGFFLPKLFYFLYYKILPGLSYIFSVPVISLRRFLLLEYGIINQNLGPRCAHCYWGCCFCALSVDRARTRVCINPRIYIYMYNYFHM